MPSYNPPASEEIRKLLANSRTIAMIGASPDPARPSHGVMQALLNSGFEVIPVRADGKSVLGRASVRSLAEIGDPVDIVNVFRRPEFVSEIVDEVIRLKLPALWLQLGVADEEAAARAQQAGVFVVMDRCIKVDHSLLGKPGPRKD